MADWSNKRTTDVSVRAGGALSCAAAYLAISALAHLHVAAPRAQPGAIAYVLAAIGFLCTSFGTALIVLGHHIFDQVEVSARWQHRAAASAPPPRLHGFERQLAGLQAVYPEAEIDPRPAPERIGGMNELPLSWRGFDAHARLSSGQRIGDGA